MRIIIVKTVMDRWKYYLDKFGYWNGLRDNAVYFSSKEIGLGKARMLQIREPNDKIECYEEY